MNSITADSTYLGNGPFHHGSACQTGTIDFLEIVVGIAQVTCLHFIANIITVDRIFVAVNKVEKEIR